MPPLIALWGAAVGLAALASPANGQSRTMTEAEMRAAFEGRTVSLRSARSGTWIMLVLQRDGRCALTWSGKAYRTRCQIRGNRFCYTSGQKRGLVCGAMVPLGGDDYLFRAE